MRQTATNRNKSETKPTTQTTINKKFPNCRNAKCLHIANNMLYKIYDIRSYNTNAQQT